jgi:hypothetical protein
LYHSVRVFDGVHHNGTREIFIGYSFLFGRRRLLE